MAGLVVFGGNVDGIPGSDVKRMAGLVASSRFRCMHVGREPAELQIRDGKINFIGGADFPGSPPSGFHGVARVETHLDHEFLIVQFRYFWPSPWTHRVVFYEITEGNFVAIGYPVVMQLIVEQHTVSL